MIPVVEPVDILWTKIMMTLNFREALSETAVPFHAALAAAVGLVFIIEVSAKAERADGGTSTAGETIIGDPLPKIDHSVLVFYYFAKFALINFFNFLECNLSDLRRSFCLFYAGIFEYFFSVCATGED